MNPKGTLLFIPSAIIRTLEFWKQTAQDLQHMTKQPLSRLQIIKAVARVHRTGQWSYNHKGEIVYPRYRYYIEDLYDALWALGEDPR